MYGIEKITKGSDKVDVSRIVHLFHGVSKEEVERSVGEVHVLIGMNYARLQPTKTQEYESHDLVLYENRFGKCIAGSHHLIRQSHQLIVVDASVHHFDANSFFDIESMGITCFPKCGNCMCKKCSLGSKGLSIKEEREQNLINEGLSYDKENMCFTSTYPWIKDPNNLPDSYNTAKTALITTEKRIQKEPLHAKTYDEQFKDLLERGAARIMTMQELESYAGRPVYYLTHHEVLKEGATTACRIVFNSSRKINGECINDYWGTGANQINNLVGVLIRYREKRVVIVGDIRKMYHAIRISELDQNTHRFLWRNLETHRDPDIYAMQVVSFGDRPSGNIALAALKKTAEMGAETHPDAANTILNNSYVDDILDSYDSEEAAHKATEEIDEILRLGGFKIKGWTLGTKCDNQLEHQTFSQPTQSVLGMHHYQALDVFKFDVKTTVAVGRKGKRKSINIELYVTMPVELAPKLSKRIIMSIIHSIFDPLGLIGPFTVKGKVIMRILWKNKLEWDDEIPVSYLTLRRATSGPCMVGRGGQNAPYLTLDWKVPWTSNFDQQ